MDFEEKQFADAWMKPSSSDNELTKQVPPNRQSYNNFNLQQFQQKWDGPSIQDYGMRIETQFPEFNQTAKASAVAGNPVNQMKIPRQGDVQMDEIHDVNKSQDWDPKAMLNNLSFLEEKIHQLQNLVHLIVGRRGQAGTQPDELLAQQQQLITADLTSVIVQLISTAGSLLPSVKQTLSANQSVRLFGQLGGVVSPPSGQTLNDSILPQNIGGSKVSDQTNHVDPAVSCKIEQHCNEEHDSKDEEDAEEGENLPPGSYEILQLEKEEILAPHTHFCTICGKGFKRDANLRMHMRGHGDEYKTPAALAKPHKESSSEPMIIKRYSCPFAGCKRNKDHKNFQPLKTILCVKNHYKRTHCDKSYTCSRCHTKKFSVIADLKTHEKHCGKDKWLCSCGTTFSRKDKLFGHIALFQGHTPAIPLDETKSAAGPSEKGENHHEAANKSGVDEFNFSSSVPRASRVENIMDFKGDADDPANFFLPLTFDTGNLSGFSEFSRTTFDDSETSFSFLISGSCSYPEKIAGVSGSNNLE